jgi:hypothetical protein
VQVDGVALIPKCAECEEVWLPADEERWRAYLTDDEPAELAFYCPACAERAFGDDLDTRGAKVDLGVGLRLSVAAT